MQFPKYNFDFLQKVPKYANKAVRKLY